MSQSHDRVVARFPDVPTAEEAIRALLNAHLPQRAITVMARSDDELVEHHLAYENGVFAGTAVGGAVGTLAGLLGAAAVGGAVAGPAGPLVVVTGGAAAGVAGGGYVGLAWWRYTARRYADEFDDQSDVWVAVDHPTLRDEAERVLRETPAQRVWRADAGEPPVVGSPYDDPGES